MRGSLSRRTQTAADGAARLSNALKMRPGRVLAFTVFCAFWLVSRRYSGPAYLSDEISYLGHAARLAGFAVDGLDGAHAGYSLFLAPLFRVFSEPGQVWQAVMMLNAAMWAATAILLTHLVSRFFPSRSLTCRLTAVAVAMSYPAWLTMSGYAFATTAIVLVFMASVVTALGVNWKQRWSIIPHSLTLGFLYWVHPTGLAVIAASVLALAVVSFRSRQWVTLGLHVLVLSMVMIVYREVLHVWLFNTGTALGFAPTFEYPSPASQLSRVNSLSFLFGMATKALGQFSYLAVGSLGLAVFGFVELAGTARESLRKRPSDSGGCGTSSGYAHLFVVLAFLGVVGMGSAFFATSGGARVDYWMYGRHADAVLLPLLAVGFLAHVRRFWILLLVVGLVACGALLTSVAFSPPTNNVVNTISFWPQFLIDRTDFLRWMALGALGVLVFQCARQLGRIGRSVALILLVLVSVLSAVNGARFHQAILDDYSKPTGLVDIVRANFETGRCVAFDPAIPDGRSLFHRERFRLHIFYLYDYAYQRMHVADWLNTCDGPLFTYDIEPLRDVPGVVLLGQEVRSGLYLVAKDSDEDFWVPSETPTERTFYPADGWTLPPQDLYRYGERLSTLPSRVGKFRDGSVFTTGRAGYLVYGPYVVMSAGEYNLVVRGDASETSSASVDVTSALGTVTHAEFALSAAEREPGVLASGRVSLDESVADLEVRVYVGVHDEVRLDGYELVPDGGRGA